jgi:hypothetical protein
MAKKQPQKRSTPDITPEEAFERHRRMDEAIVRFTGNFDELEGAIGMYMIGRHLGWKVLYLIHSKRTIRKYEEILDISVREVFPAEGPDADRSNAFRAVQAVSNFWKAVSGEVPIPDKKHGDAKG